MAYKITWKPSPNLNTGRSGYQPIAIVQHRMVGSLPGTDAHFAGAANEVSAHFGIGRRTSSGPVEISQYVDLSDTAWGNGNYDPSGGWPLVKKASTGTVINPNRYTVSIEHQDGASANSGVVAEEFVNASIWLSKLMLTGSSALMRAAGIRIRDEATAVALGGIVVGPETIIDHNRISGKLKPYCWRPWLNDPGFVPYWKPIYLAALTENSMNIDEILALLGSAVDELQAERDAAIAARDLAIANLAKAEAKLAVAKSKGAEIAAL